MSMLLMWGPHTFESGAIAYEELTHKWGGRWKDHDVIGRRPAGQYTGPEKETIAIKGAVFPLHQEGNTGMITAMQQAAGAGDVHLMVSGTGEVLGSFRLDSMSRSESFIGPAGVAMKVSYDLAFTYQDDDEGAVFGVWPG